MTSVTPRLLERRRSDRRFVVDARADWASLADNCTNWPAAYGDDVSCVGGPGGTFSNIPGVMRRGGRWNSGTDAGVFAVNGGNDPSEARADTGFRCAR